MLELVLPRVVVQRGGALSSLLEILSDFSVSRAFLVVDEESKFIVDSIVKMFGSMGIEHRIGNLEGKGIPSENEIKKLVSLLDNFKPDALLAIGASKVIFAFKLLGVLIKRPLLDIKDITPVTKISLEFERPLFIMIPICGGWATGCLRTAIYKDVNGNIIPLVNRSFVPHAIILDPNLISRLTKRTLQSALGGLLAQAIESYLSSSSGDLTRTLALHSIRLAFEYTERAFKDPSNVKAYEKIQQACLVSGIACGAPSLSLSILLGLSLSETLKIPSGIASGIILPTLLRFYEQYSKEARDMLSKVKIFIEALLSLEYKETFSDHLENLYSRVSFPRHFSELGISESDYEVAINKALEDLSSGFYKLAFSPVKPSVEHLIKILRHSYK